MSTHITNRPEITNVNDLIAGNTYFIQLNRPVNIFKDFPQPEGESNTVYGIYLRHVINQDGTINVVFNIPQIAPRVLFSGSYVAWYKDITDLVMNIDYWFLNDADMNMDTYGGRTSPKNRKSGRSKKGRKMRTTKRRTTKRRTTK
jgi:uncharacterized protein YneR